MSLVSCEFFEGTSSHKIDLQGVKTIEQLQDTIKTILIAQDSLYAGLVNQINTMSDALNSSNKHIAELSEKVSKIEEPTRIWNYVTLTCAVLIIILLLVVLYIWKYAVDEKQINEIIYQFRIIINNLEQKINNIEQYSGKSNNGSRGQTSNDSYQALQQALSRIDVLEKELKLLKGNSREESSAKPGFFRRQDSKEASMTHVGYAKINEKQFFTEVFDNLQEACVFKISYRNDNEGIFNLISLEKIKSRNGWQDIVEYTGDCTIADATSYKVVEEGRCKKIDSATWEVTKNLIIKIWK